MNVVPTPATRSLARAAIEHASRESGADAALAFIPRVRPGQLAAFVGLLAQAAAGHQPPADELETRRAREQARMAAEEASYTDEELRRAHTRYCWHGARDPWTVTGERVYQRRHKRKAG